MIRSSSRRSGSTEQIVVALIGGVTAILAAVIAANPGVLKGRGSSRDRGMDGQRPPLVEMKPEPRGRSSAGNPGTKESPRPLSPVKGEIVRFRDSPMATLQWSPVPGAVAYQVEIQRQNRVAFVGEQSWAAYLGPIRVQNLVNTPQGKVGEYVVANPQVARLQPLRWRVWAVGPSDEEGERSDWQDFRFDWFASDPRRETR